MWHSLGRETGRNTEPGPAKGLNRTSAVLTLWIIPADCAAATAESSAGSRSPDSAIEEMMSQPPTSSPPAYSCGNVGQSENFCGTAAEGFTRDAVCGSCKCCTVSRPKAHRSYICGWWGGAIACFGLVLS